MSELSYEYNKSALEAYEVPYFQWIIQSDDHKRQILKNIWSHYKTWTKSGLHACDMIYPPRQPWEGDNGLVKYHAAKIQDWYDDGLIGKMYNK